MILDCFLNCEFWEVDVTASFGLVVTDEAKFGTWKLSVNRHKLLILLTKFMASWSVSLLMRCKSFLQTHSLPIIIYIYIYFLLSGFSFTDTNNSQDSRGREGTFFYFTLPLPPAHEHSDIYVQLCTWDDYHIFLIATLVFTRLLLDEIYNIVCYIKFEWIQVIV